MKTSSAMYRLTVTALSLAFYAGAAYGSNIGVGQSIDANMLASTVLAGGAALVSNSAEVTTHTLASDIKFCAGTFTDAALASGLSSGVALSTGWVGDLADPNSGVSGDLVFGDTGVLPAGVDGTSYDPCHLKFEFICPSWANTVQVQYVFASEDYTASGTVQAYTADQMYVMLNGFSTANNIALVPNTNLPVSSQTINKGVNSGYFRDNTASPPPLLIQSSGLTTVLTASGPADETGTQSIDFFVTDMNGATRDSWLMIKPGSLTCLGCPSMAAAPELTAVSTYQFGDTYKLGLPVGYVPVSVNWGDGSPEDSLMTHQYTAAGTFNISVVSRYSDSSCFPATTFEDVVEQTVSPRSCTYPTVSSSLSGSTATINLSSLPAGFKVSIDWDNGNVVTNRAATTFATTYNSFALYNVKVTLTDERGCLQTTTVPISYCGAAPVPSFSSLTPMEGSAITLSLSNFAGYVANVDWDDFSAIDDGATLYTHKYADNGSYSVKVRAYTAAGCFADSTTTLMVANVKPTVSISGPSSSTTNTDVTFTLSCNDAGTKDGESLVVNWGDQQSSKSTIVAPASLNCNNIAFTHKYAAVGTYKVTATAMDKDYSSTEVYTLISITRPPTASPTKAPTKSPTKTPTSPTKSPTKTPTKSPTKSPTKAPTQSPVAISPSAPTPSASAPSAIVPAPAPSASQPMATSTMAPTYAYNSNAKVAAEGTFTGPTGSATFAFSASYQKSNFKGGGYPIGFCTITAPNVNFVNDKSSTNAKNNDNYLVYNSLYVIPIDATTTEGGFTATSGLGTATVTKAKVQFRKSTSNNNNNNSVYSIKVNIWNENSSGAFLSSVYSMSNFVTVNLSGNGQSSTPTLASRMRKLLRANSGLDKEQE